MKELQRRVAAAQATLDAVKGQPFRLGRLDCARMTAAHLRRLGHKVRLPAAGSYASERTARKKLAERGFADLPAALDSMGFERIAPAAALPSDIVAVPSASSIGCLMVVLTNGRACGFLDDHAEGATLQPVEYVAAWRVPCLESR